MHMHAVILLAVGLAQSCQHKPGMSMRIFLIITIIVLRCVWKESWDTMLHLNAQIVLRQAVIARNLSPAINDTTAFTDQISVQKCEIISAREAECQALIRGFRIWNVRLIYTMLNQF